MFAMTIGIDKLTSAPTIEPSVSERRAFEVAGWGMCRPTPWTIGLQIGPSEPDRSRPRICGWRSAEAYHHAERGKRPGGRRSATNCRQTSSSAIVDGSGTPAPAALAPLPPDDPKLTRHDL